MTVLIALRRSHFSMICIARNGRLIAKERIGSRTVKRYDSPKTPYRRILESVYIPMSVKHSLVSRWEQMNPFVLRKAMEAKLKKIFRCCYNGINDESPTP